MKIDIKKILRNLSAGIIGFAITMYLLAFITGKNPLSGSIF